MRLKDGQLSKIRISGYKSIKNCEMDFGKINVLIGSNGAGKSNFISAFSLLQNILLQNSAAGLFLRMKLALKG